MLYEKGAKMDHYIKKEMLLQFKEKMIQDEKGSMTIQKYLRDVKAFCNFIGEERKVNKEIVVQYKNSLLQNYAPASINSMLAALNRFFKEMGWYDCTVKALKIQRVAFRDQEKELSKKEYLRLVGAAEKSRNHRLSLLMQTICATGIRVSELRFITVDSLVEGCAVVSLKGKTRKVLLPSKLCCSLKKYAKKRGIKKGSIFVTKTGKPLDRSNILHDMKKLCEQAKVDRKKVFPHNLRHLFACLYYQNVKDLSRLADLLGHSNVNTTRIYTCVSGQEQKRQIEKLGLIWLNEENYSQE